MPRSRPIAAKPRSWCGASTGAAKTVSFGPVIRTNATGAHGHNQPAYGAHVDYGDRTVRDFTYDLLPKEEADRRLQGRYMLINVWRPLEMVESAPLALCDASTVKREGYVRQRSDRRPRQFRDPLAMGLQPCLGAGAEMVLGAAYAAMGSTGVQALRQRSRGGAVHRAQRVQARPNTPHDAAPRQSIEVRTISYLD